MKLKIVEEFDDNFSFDEIVESGTSRVYSHITGDKSWGMVSADRSEYNNKENKQRRNNLKRDIRQSGFGFIEFESKWVEDGYSSDEIGFLVPNADISTMIALGTRYNQSSVIVCDEKGCREICTTPFESFKQGDVVRKFNLNSKTPLNINDAREIFAGRLLNRAVSKPKKGSNPTPFTLSEVYEVLEANPVTFRGPSLRRIF